MISNVVIMGCGQIGVTIATTLSEKVNLIHILDIDPGAFALLPPRVVHDGRVVPAVCDGTLIEDLRKAISPDAGVFIAVAGEDAVNAVAAQFAKHILHIPTVICRIDDPDRKEVYSQMDLITVSSASLFTDTVMQAGFN